jgi:3-hydroxyisobutyrate dehydrogenase-like beta-hydroxyacid dehydrogenase
MPSHRGKITKYQEIEMNAPTVGLIGIGNMGHAMALRLLEQGVALMVCDRNPAVLESLQSQGVRVASDPAALADVCEIIIASLPSREASLHVALGESGVIKGKAIKVYVETSTLGSTTIRQIADGLSSHDIGLIDAPISGAPVGARAGTLAVLASGASEHYELVRPVFEKIAGNIFYLGEEPGISQVAKLINNNVSCAGRVAVFEGLAIAIKAGIDPKTMNDIFNAGSGRNFTTTHKVEAAILSGSFKFAAPLSIGMKDEALLQEEAKRYNAPMWIAPRILELFREAAAAGYKEEDSMKLFLYIQSLSLPDGGAKVAPQWDQGEA